MERCLTTCTVCKKQRYGRLPIYCACGNVIGKATEKTHSQICLSCPNYNDRRCIIQQQVKPDGGWVSYLDSHPEVRCPSPDPQWFVGPIGFLSVSYMDIGGTETFHQTLLPNLKGVAGFVSLSPTLSKGDFSLLGCQTGIGIEAARRLARDVKVLVVWGVGQDLTSILEPLPKKPMVISVAHCDATSVWTRQYMQYQEKWSNHFVYINKAGIGTVPLLRRQQSTLIYNGINEKKTYTNRTREEIRSTLGVPPTAKLGIMVTRYSEEKGVVEAMAAARQTPHYFFVVGNASSWNQHYLKQITHMQTDRVRLIPAQHPAPFYKAADYYLSLSQYEGFGLSMAEAMSVGVQVISTPVGIVEDHPECAHILPKKPVTEDVVNAILSPKDTRAVAQELIRTHYNSQVFVSNWQRLLDGFSGMSIQNRQQVRSGLPIVGKGCRG